MLCRRAALSDVVHTRSIIVQRGLVHTIVCNLKSVCSDSVHMKLNADLKKVFADVMQSSYMKIIA